MNEVNPLPSILPVTLPGGTVIEFRRIPACLEGFRMGSRGNSRDEEPIHRVVIPQDFYLGTFPVTQAQYRAMAEACRAELSRIEHNNGSDPSRDKGDMRPVENVSWDEAMLMGRWLSRSGLLVAGWQAGLPSEEMWEYACGAGSETEYWNGDGEAALEEVGWHDGNSGQKTHPVGELPANDFGLHDLHGNVWEWCADVYDEDTYRTHDYEIRASNVARAVEDDRDRVLRGGSWYDTARNCRAASRFRLIPDNRNRISGFRLCLFPGPVQYMQTEAEPTGQVGGRARRRPHEK